MFDKLFKDLFKTEADIDQFLKKYFNEEKAKIDAQLKVDIALAQADYRKARADVLLAEKDKQIAFLSDLVKQFAAKKIEVELVK